MFLWITTSGANPASVQWSDWLEALDNLGEAGFRRDHLVLGDRAAILEILRVTDLSRRARAYFQSVATKLTTLGAIARVIRPTFVDVNAISAHQGATGVVVPIAHFKSLHSLERALLLCEHMYDCTLAEEFSLARLRGLGLARIGRLSLRHVVGGGGGIHLTLSTYQLDAETLGVCIIDSDRAHPFDALGTTASTAKGVFEEGWKWCLHIIEARELENLIPPEVAAACGLAKPRLSNYFNNEAWAIGGYVDFKLEHGDKLCRYFSINPSSQSKRHVRDAIAHLRTCAVVGGCCAASDCSGEGNCVLTQYNKDMLKRVATWATPMGVTARLDNVTTVDAFDRMTDAVVAAGLAPGFAVL